MGGIVCGAWIRLLGIPGNMEGRIETGSKEGMFVQPQNLLFPLQSVMIFLLRYYFYPLPTSVKSVRELAVKDFYIYVHKYI